MRQILFAGAIGLFLTLVGTPLLIKLLASGRFTSRSCTSPEAYTMLPRATPPIISWPLPSSAATTGEPATSMVAL